MGVCSYCLLWQSQECFGWDEARRCCGITGPDDPRRAPRRRDLDEKRERAKTSEIIKEIRKLAAIIGCTFEECPEKVERFVRSSISQSTPREG